MKRAFYFVSIAVLCSAFAFTACKSKDEKATEEQPAASEEAKPTPPAPPALPGLPAPTKDGQPPMPPEDLMKALAQGAPGGKAVDPISYKELKKFLPVDADGWKLEGEATGQTAQMMGFSVSQAECKLTKDKMNAKITLVDTSLNPMLAMPYNMTRSMKLESDEEKRGPVDINGTPGAMSYKKKNNTAQILTLIKNRVLVTVEVEGIADEKAAVDLAAKIDYEKLAALVK